MVKGGRMILREIRQNQESGIPTIQLNEDLAEISQIRDFADRAVYRN